MLNIHPETSVVKMAIIQELVRGAYGAPVDASLLRPVICLFLCKAAYEFAHNLYDMVCLLLDNRRVTVLLLQKVVGHSVAIHPLGQHAQLSGRNSKAHHKIDQLAVLAAELGLGPYCREGMASLSA